MAKRHLHIDRDFPGGNIIVDSIDGNVVRLRQDHANCSENWFYWCFRIRGAAHRHLRFEFTDGDVLGPRGPAFSPDGQNWRWLGPECVDGPAFVMTFPRYARTSWFAFCHPYTQRNLEHFLLTRPRVERSVLARSEKGRDIEHLTLRSKYGTFVVPLTARMHACETMGDYAIEGVIDYVLSGEEDESLFLREHVDLQIIPFFDKDGVEDGDQGKARLPHDHGRDFTDSPLYASTRAFMAALPTWRGRLVMALDLHCPWIRGSVHERLMFVGTQTPWQTRLDQFCSMLEQAQKGELTYRATGNLPLGQDWNKGVSPTPTRWIRGHFPVDFAAACEIPYALSLGQTVTPDNVRAFGADLARAIAIYLMAK
jgi:murein tripeptide amidase MpaA